MSKFIKSPVPEYPGEVGLSDPMTFPQLFALEDAFSAVKVLKNKSGERVNYALLPGLLACCDAWHIEGLPEHPTPENFPASPAKRRRAVAALLAWLTDELGALFRDTEIPNA